MVVTIFGATEPIGLQVMQQALAKNHIVKAFGRNVEQLIDKDLHNDKFIAIKGYVFDAADVAKAIKGSDIVVSCLGGGVESTDKTRSLGIKNIIAQMHQCHVNRLVAVGGIGVLNAADDTLIMDTEEFPEELKTVSLEHLNVWEQLQLSNLNFTFVCVPHVVKADAISEYTTSPTYMPIPNKNVITTANIAHCILQCIEKNEHIKQKIGLSNL